MARIQLLIEDDRNRELLASALADDHEVVEQVSDPEAFLATAFDLCLVDWPAFRDYRETMAEKKERDAPAFLPYLLLLSDRDPGRAPEDVWERVDEVIDTPIERGALENRVSNLLQRRELSVELKRRQEFTEERFRTLFESTPDPIVVVTDDGIVTEVNDAFVDVFGVDREAIRNQHVSDIDAAPRESVERLLLRVEGDDESAAESRDESEDPGSATVEVGSASGDTHLTELNVDVVEELGEATERIGIFRDVTNREAYQRELERQVEQLERFAGVISHDLRDPLNTAQAKTRLVRREQDHEKLGELADVLDRMEVLIDDVLTLAKQGKAVGESEPVELGSVLAAAWSTVDAPEEATLRCDDDLPVVEADEERLQALLENLLRNSVEHAGPDVTIRVGVLADSDGFYVEDDGPGIPDDERESVFVYGHTTAEGGTGLGLAIVDQIADAHGWEVHATDGESGGARFEITGVEIEG